MSVLEYLSLPARQASVVQETAHRPWPLPGGTWVMAQTWDDLLFAHWRVPAETIRPLIPDALSIDEYDGTAWLGITPFILSGFRLRGTFPVPRLSTFPELNVRTYVTAEDKPGIWFFSLDTSSQLAVEGARRVYRLPYYHARMSARRTGETIDYSSARREGPARPFVFQARYRPTGAVFNAQADSLEDFLAERSCLYRPDRGGVLGGETHPPPWPLQVAEAEIEQNTMTPPGVELAGEPLLHFAARQDVLIWSPVPLD